ncbi:MAG: abortive infection protein [Bacteroidetes bacterium]|nr:MAG: abortive infection protein [Bacteroidota bacterium]
MKKIIGYIKDFYRNHFKWSELIVALIFLMGFCFFRYYHYIPYNGGKQSLLTNWWYKSYFAGYRFSFHFVLYIVPLLLGYLVSSIVHKKWDNWKNPKFIFLVIFGVAIFSFRSSITFFLNDYLDQFQHEHLDWLTSILGTISRGLFLFSCIFLYWFFVDRKNQPFYGFTLKNYDTKPYLVMLLIMIPLITAASLLPDFLTSYPRVEKINSLSLTNAEHFRYLLSFEVLYGLDFFSIEFFFRGFMILAFVGIVGPRAVIPMAYIYFVIHWNKPMGELISSFFGGSLLGIIAYYSRSIVGGIIVHVGIAWMMELGAFISKYIDS